MRGIDKRNAQPVADIQCDRTGVGEMRMDQVRLARQSGNVTEQRGLERGPIGNGRFLRQILPVAGINAADMQLGRDGFNRYGIGCAQRWIIDQPGDDLDLVDVARADKRGGSPQHIRDVATGILGQSKFDRRTFDAAPQGER